MRHRRSGKGLPESSENFLEKLRSLINGNTSGEHWGRQSDQQKRKKIARLPLGKELAYKLGTQGEDIDRVNAQLLWLEAGLSAGTPKIAPADGGFTATVTPVRGSRWTYQLGFMIRCKSDRFKALVAKRAQVVMLEYAWVGARASFQQAVLDATGHWTYAKHFGEARTITFNGPLIFDLDRPLQSDWIDMVVTITKILPAAS